MSFLDQNLQALKTHHPELAQRIEGQESVAPPEFDVATQTALSQNFWSQQKLTNPLLMVFYGFDQGYHLKDYIRSPHPKNRLIFVIEKSLAHFAQALTLQDWTVEIANKRICWIVGLDPPALQNWFHSYFLNIISLCYTESQHNIMWEPSLRADGPYYVAAAEALKNGSHLAIKSFMSDPEDNFRGLMNLMDNIPSFSESAGFFDSFKDAFKNKPCIIVSTGPSLDFCLPIIDKIKDKAVLIAVDSAASVLLKNNITPHFVTCLERDLATAKLIEVLPKLELTPLICLPIIHPQTYQAYQGKHLLYLSSGFQYNWLFGDKNTHALGNTASTVAYQAANLMGCDPIILTGQDLAFERNTGKSHADESTKMLQDFGASLHQAAVDKNDDQDIVEGNNGEAIRTNHVYRSFADKFVKFISESKAQTYNAIPSDYGMKIAGSVRIDPQSMDQLVSDDFDGFQKIKDNLSLLNTQDFSADVLNQNIQKGIHYLNEIETACLTHLKKLSTFFHENPPTAITQDFEKKYDHLFNQIDIETHQNLLTQPGLLQLVWPFVVLAYVTHFTRIYKLWGDRENFKDNIRPILDSLLNWFQAVLLWTVRIRHYLTCSK